MNPLHRMLTRLNVWAVASQHQARRNAMIASTRLAQRRAERIEVEEFLAVVATRKHQAGAGGPRTADSVISRSAAPARSVAGP